MQYLPSKNYFSPKTEEAFQYQLNRNSKRLATIVLYLSIVFLMSLTIISLISEDIGENLVVNIIRGVMTILAVILIYRCRNKKFSDLHKRFFAYGVLFCCLSNYLFWSHSQIHNELKEGGPMLVVASFVVIPMLHLGHKLILWFILGINLVAIQVLTPVSIMWTLYFYIAIVIAMGGIQYQLDILLRKQYRAELIEAEKAKTDQLTGVHNRHSFDEKFKSLIEKLQPSQYIALAMIDIDYFKKYNDNYGHLEGDSVLVKVAELLSDCQADIVVRFGGEEFILVKVLHEDELKWLNDLPQRFVSRALPHKYSSFNCITVSVGIAIAKHNEQPILTKTLLTEADAVMYQAKNSGRNQVITSII